MKSKEIINSIILVMMVVLISVVAALVVGTILDNSLFTSITLTGSNTNESIGVVDNITNVTLAIKSTISNAVCSLTTLYNSTGGEIITSGNYTFYTTDCNIILTSASSYIGESLNVTYGYSYLTNNTISGVNVVELKTNFGLFITGLIAFLSLIGVIVGVVWLVSYVKMLFDKKDGLQGIAA